MKNVKFLNVSCDGAIYDRLVEFCAKTGMNKTSTTERALTAYMDKMEKILIIHNSDDILKMGMSQEVQYED